MPHKLRLILALHNHQPVGNFDGVCQQALEESYWPFLNTIANFPHLRWALHTSGSLAEWLDKHDGGYLDRLAELVAADRLEVIGGAFYEPILTMLPSRDRVGQIRGYSQWLERRLGARVRGMWMPERVWEQSLARDLAQANIGYTILDDFHFQGAGLTEEQLDGYYLTEDDGRLLGVFPGSERLRYTIPFGSPEATIDHLRAIAERRPNAVVVFADDGEKFGTWPDTHRHVYTDGWLVRFFEALTANRDWLETTTPSDALEQVPPLGKVYLPDASYREMTEWALPAKQLEEYVALTHACADWPQWSQLKRYVRGGFWRNFKVKYPEADEMYTRMLQVSQRLEAAEAAGQSSELVERARTELYRGQCNCSYWHGAFGGIYLPHLRNAVYRSLIAADNLLDQAQGRHEPWVEVVSGDFNLDGRPEVQLANDRMAAWLSPAQGGQLYELDVRSICHNLLATLARRPEAYHRKVLAGAAGSEKSVSSIHDRVVFKQAGLDQRLQYDQHLRKSLQDHFFDHDVAAEAVAMGQAMERGDFLGGVYETRLRRGASRCQAVLTRDGNAWGCPLRITKSVTMEAGSSALEVHYELEGLPAGRPLHFAMEWNFAGLPAGADDRYFYDIERRRLGTLGTRLDLTNADGIGLADQWLGIGVGLRFSRPTGVWTFPIETVSTSEGGFELVHQSVAVLPHWIVTGDAAGRWQVALTLSLDTALAESRSAEQTLVGAP